ncbi:MAG: hypothetical protein Q7U75_13550 [Desulfobacterales bacterium]|nr:hypothetical protein [Desulfobacterales bacterium]
MLLTVQAVGSAEDDRAEDQEGTVVEVVQRVPRLDDELFDLWVFGGNRERHRQELARKLDVAVKILDSKYSLSEAEQKKLVLAGQVDLQRYFAEAEVLRQKFHETCGDHRKLRDVHREALEFREAGDSRLFDGSSFFAKVVRRTLNVVASSRATASRPQQRRSAGGEVVSLERIASLRLEPFEALEAPLLVLAENLPIHVGEEDDILTKYRMTEFSEEQLRPLFDEAQWPRVRVVLNVYQNYRAGLEAWGLFDGRTGRLRTDWDQVPDDRRLPAREVKDLE